MCDRGGTFVGHGKCLAWKRGRSVHVRQQSCGFFSFGGCLGGVGRPNVRGCRFGFSQAPHPSKGFLNKLSPA